MQQLTLIFAHCRQRPRNSQCRRFQSPSLTPTASTCTPQRCALTTSATSLAGNATRPRALQVLLESYTPHTHAGDDTKQSAQGSVHLRWVPASSCLQILLQEDAKLAFKQLLASVGMRSDWSWEQAMRLIVSDPRCMPFFDSTRTPAWPANHTQYYAGPSFRALSRITMSCWPCTDECSTIYSSRACACQ